MNEQQLTPETADQLLELLNDLAAIGGVRVTVQGRILGAPHRGGKLTCKIADLPHGPAIDCTLNHIRIGGIPIRPKGFMPTKEGDGVAYFMVRWPKITIRYILALDQGRQVTGFRRFQPSGR